MGDLLGKPGKGLNQQVDIFMGIGVGNAEDIGLIGGDTTAERCQGVMIGDGFGKGAINPFRDGHYLVLWGKAVFDNLGFGEFRYRDNMAAAPAGKAYQGIKGGFF